MKQPGHKAPAVQTAAPEAPRKQNLFLRLLRRGGKVLRLLLMLLLALLCAAVCYVAVILGDSPELDEQLEESTANTALAAPAALPGGQALSSRELEAVAAYFPGLLAQVAPASGINLSQGSAMDLSIGGTTCRVVALRYTVGGESLTLYSATPSLFLQRYAGDQVQVSETSASLGILSAILVTQGDKQVLLARQGDVVYALEAPVGFSSMSQLAAWVVFE